MSNEATVPGIGVCECESCRQGKECEHPVDALVLKWMDHGEKRVLCSCGYDFGPVRELIEKAAKADFVLAYKATLDNAETPSVFHTLFESELREENQKLQKEFDTYRESHGITNDRAKALEDERNTSQNKRKMAEGQVLMLRAEIDNVRKERDEAHVEAQEAHSRADIYLDLANQKQAEFERLTSERDTLRLLEKPLREANREFSREMGSLIKERDEARKDCATAVGDLERAVKERDDVRKAYHQHASTHGYPDCDVLKLVKERDELKARLDAFPLGSHAVISLGEALGFRGNSWDWCIDRVISLREKADRMDDIIAITRQVKP